MSPREEIAAAVKELSDASDEVNRFIRAMNPTVGRALADWLRTWEGFEFREDGPMPDDLAAALRIARAVNGGTR